MDTELNAGDIVYVNKEFYEGEVVGEFYPDPHYLLFAIVLVPYRTIGIPALGYSHLLPFISRSKLIQHYVIWKWKSQCEKKI